MLSSASKHSIVILQFLAKVNPDEYYPVAEIAEITDAPAPYLSKLVKELSWAGVIESKRGVGGGIRLSADARGISLYEICELMKDPVVKQQCVLRNQPCNPKKPCAFHANFSETRNQLVHFLQDSKIGETSLEATHSS